MLIISIFKIINIKTKGRALNKDGDSCPWRTDPHTYSTECYTHAQFLSSWVKLIKPNISVTFNINLK